VLSWYPACQLLVSVPCLDCLFDPLYIYLSSPNTLLLVSSGNDICEAGENSSSCSADCGPKFLETTFEDNNGSVGNVFKVRAEKDITVTGFNIHTSNAGTYTVRVYDRSGDYVGVYGSSTGWRTIFNGNVNCQGQDSPTVVGALSQSVSISAGSTHSFHIQTDSGIRYTNGSTEGNVYAGNDDITFYQGRGCGGVFNCGYSPRVWNGIIQYELDLGSPTTPQPTVKPTAFPTISVSSYSCLFVIHSFARHQLNVYFSFLSCFSPLPKPRHFLPDRLYFWHADLQEVDAQGKLKL